MADVQYILDVDDDHVRPLETLLEWRAGEVDVDDVVPMKVYPFREWTSEELAARAADWVVSYLPEGMRDDEELNSSDFEGEYDDAFTENEVAALTAALVSWAKRCSPGCWKALPARTLTPEDWRRVDLVVDEEGVVLEVIDP